MILEYSKSMINLFTKNRSLFCILTILVVLSCKPSTPVYESFTGFIQGTTYSIVYQKTDDLDPVTLKEITEKLLHDFDLSLSLYKDSSVLSRLNRNEPVKPDALFIEVFNQSKELWELTDGAFDVTVGPLVKAWGFGPDAKRNFDESIRDSLLSLVGMDKVSLANGRLIKSDPRITLDFNAIAQGYSVDIVCDHFDQLKIKSYLVEIGGEVRVKGTRNGNPWRIGIDSPDDNNMLPGDNLQAIIKMTDKSLATSGNYRKFYVENGMKYSHTIDPRTGYPAKNQLLSATILAEKCSIADGYATACMVMGKEKSIEFILKNNLEAYLIYSDEKGNYESWVSENLKNNLSED
jgi:FAD:protein FMN transferase